MPFVDVRERLCYSAEKMTKVALLDAPQMFVDAYCLEPGQAQRPHAHRAEAKLYFVLEGEGVFLVDGEERPLGPGHAVLAPAGEPHGVRNDGPERLVLLVAMAPNPNRAA
jgi:mannose-6-phosphate isomerase-like protein (cupin superfamily)